MSLPRYPEYRDSGVEWLGEVPAHWTVTSLKRGFDVRLGKMLQPAKSSDEDVLAPYLRAANIQWGGVDLEDVRSMWFSPRERELLALQTGDLLVSEGGDVGRSSLWRAQVPCCYFQNSVNRVRARGQDRTEYLYYWMATIKAKGYVDVLCNKSTIAHFTAEKVAAVPAIFPEPQEQRQIATFLDRETAKIDALIAEQEKLLALLAEKRQATISHAVTRGLDPNAPMKDSGIPWLGDVPAHWKVTKCGRFLSILSGFAFPSSGFDHDGNGMRLLRGVNVAVSALRWDDVVYWERTPGDGLDDYELKVGDLVIGMDRPLIAAGMRVAKVKKQDVPCLLLQRVALLRTSSLLDSDFLMRCLSSPLFVAHFAPETTGVSVPHISPDQIASFVIAVPPLEEQQQIVGFAESELGKLRDLSKQAEQTISLLQERRSALIAAAVTGQIDVRGIAA